MEFCFTVIYIRRQSKSKYFADIFSWKLKIILASSSNNDTGARYKLQRHCSIEIKGLRGCLARQSIWTWKGSIKFAGLYDKKYYTTVREDKFCGAHGAIVSNVLASVGVPCPKRPKGKDSKTVAS